ncbi:MAG: hypothetical protein EAZ30_05900 [Betaproteobacteria bacterium]|nr:MAG: hypothetical protein EAZ30_05900 [Betaproteobacteria bacterium]
MQATSVYDEGYDALDLATNVAAEYVRKFQTGDLSKLISPNAPESAQVARTLMTVDTACELPQAWLDANSIGVIPRIIKLRSGDVLETRDNDSTLKFIEEIKAGGHADALSAPLSPLEMRDQLQKLMSSGTDAVLQVSSAASRSKFFVNALSATQSLVLIHNKVRRSMGNKTPLTAWVVDSLNAFGGVGVQLAHAVSLRESGATSAQIAVALNAFRRNVHTLIVPHDLSFIERTARSVERVKVPRWKIYLAGILGIRPIFHLNADTARTMGRASNYALAIDQVFRATESQIKLGLASPFICVSYAGRLEDIESSAEFVALRALCHRNSIALSLSVMSMTGVLMLGPRALSVSFASQHLKT